MPEPKVPVGWQGQPLTNDPMFARQFDPMVGLRPGDLPSEGATPSPELDAFNVDYTDPAQLKPSGYDDPRYPGPFLPPSYQSDFVTGIKGEQAGAANRLRLAQEQMADPTRFTTGEYQPQAPGQQGELTFAQLMAGLPRTNSSWSRSTTNAVISPEEEAGFRGRIGAANEATREAIDNRASIAQAANRDISKLHAERAQGLAAAYKVHEAKRLQVEAQIDAQMADNQAMLQEIKNAHIDPERMYKGDGGGLKKFMHALSVTLGAAGAGLAGGPNAGLQIVNAQLDRDMKAQVLNLNKKKAAFQMGRSIVGDLFQKTGDLEKSFVMGRMVYTDIAKAQLDAIASNAKSQDVVAAAELQKAALDKSQVASEMELKKLAYRKVVKQSSGGGMSPVAKMVAKALIQRRLGGGKPQKAPPPLAQKIATGASSTLDLFNELENRVKKYGYGRVSRQVLLTEAAKTRDQFVKPLLNKIPRELGGEVGVLTAQDIDRYRAGLGETFLGHLLVDGGDMTKRVQNFKTLLYKQAKGKLDALQGQGYNLGPMYQQLEKAYRGSVK